GVYEHNQWLAKKRAKEFENVVKKELGLDESGLNVVVRPGGEAWELLRERIVTDENISDVARERILKLLDDPKVGWDTKKWRMENGRLGSTRKEGDLYRWLLVNHYRYLRSLAVDIYVSNVLVAIDGGKVDVVPEEPVMEQEPTQTEPADSTEILFEPEPTLTDEVPEAGVTVNVEPLEYEPIERLDSIVRQPVLVDHERKCALRMPERGEEAAMDEETAETGESAQEQAAEPAEAAPEQDYGPFWPVLGVGTNLLYDLTYIPNYGLTSIPSVSVEYYPESGKYTIGADIEWPNWRHEGEHRFLQIHNIGLWGRYYFKPEQYRFNGFYLGGGANAAMFGLGWNKKGWNGEGIGISAGGGYKWTFGRIYIDVGAALGVFYARYDSYTWGGDATGRYYYDYVGDPEKFVPRSKRWLWLGPTRIQATVGIDLFNRNRRKAR
ncbi:MAG: DUF3575 domain-containing protein, partial [Bacteroidales bacterium]|nr:DUF3575 domain-containing protein [Bacteroidales bacterium]